MSQKISPIIAFATIFALLSLALQLINFQNLSLSREIKSYNNTLLSELDENNNLYEDLKAGFTLRYPDKVTLGEPLGDRLTLTIKNERIENIDYPLGFDQENIQKDLKELARGLYGREMGCAFAPSKEVVTIGQNNDVYAKDFIRFVCLEVCDVQFSRVLIFYKNGYQVLITLTGEKDKIMASMPEYFVNDPVSCGGYKIWNFELQNEFYQALESHQGSVVAQSWYDTFENIVKTIKFNY